MRVRDQSLAAAKAAAAISGRGMRVAGDASLARLAAIATLNWVGRAVLSALLILYAGLLPAAAQTVPVAAEVAAVESDAGVLASEHEPSLQGEGFVAFDFEWRDAGRHRAVPVRLYLPDHAAAGAPVPLVVFSHGIGGSRKGYSYLGRHWSSQGIASLHLQHVGSDRDLWFGNPFGLIGRLHDAAQDSEAVARVRDLRFALDRLLAGPMADRIDARRIVAAGHSYGANTTLLAAGARVERGGTTIDLRDERIKAAIVLSSPPFYGEADAGAVLRGVTVPTLHVTSTDDVIRIPGYYSAASDRIKVFDAVPGPRKTLAVFAGGSHSMFTDRAGSGGIALNPQVKEATRALTLAFLRSVFDGDQESLRRWPARFADILARFTPPAR